MSKVPESLSADCKEVLCESLFLVFVFTFVFLYCVLYNLVLNSRSYIYYRIKINKAI